MRKNIQKRILINSLSCIIFCSIIIISSVFAVEVNIESIRNVAMFHLAVHNRSAEISQPDTDFNYTVKNITPLLDDSSTRKLVYIVSLNPHGYIAISTDTDIRPVIAYSFSNNFNFEDFPQNVCLHLLSADMRNRLDAINLTSPEIKSKNNLLWEYHIKSEESFLEILATTATYGPWIDTQWGQGGFYASSCPIDPETSRRSIAGCGPVAMGQIINYWEFPTSFSFPATESYWSIYTDPHIWIDATTASMSTIDYNGDGIHPTRSTIGSLLYACGIILKAGYSSRATASWCNAGNFKKYGYGTAITMEGSDPDFYFVLQNNLINSKPAFLSVDGPSTAGHAIVCDGYKDSGSYHLNMGWSGSSDAWYYLPTGMPAGFDVIRTAVVNIEPIEDPTNDPPLVLRIPTDYSTIQEALDVALTGDTVIVKNGRYFGTGNVDLTFKGKGIYLRSESGALACTLDCQRAWRAFHFYNGENSNSVIDGFTIYNGRRNDGAAIGCESSSPTIKNNIFKYNSGQNGAIYLLRFGNARITNNEFTENQAYSSGTIFSYRSFATINSNSIHNNTVNMGGAVNSVLSGLIITHNEIYENTGTHAGAILSVESYDSIAGNLIYNNTVDKTGGAISIIESQPKITLNEFRGNRCDSLGGAIYIFKSNPSIYSNSFIADTALLGGAIYGYSTEGNISHNTIDSCNADFGGGIFCQHSNLSIIENTIDNNTAIFGGGICLLETGSSIRVNTLESNNARLGGGMYIYFSAPSLTGNELIRNNSTQDGGGIYVDLSEFAIHGNEFTENSAENHGGGIYFINSIMNISENDIHDNIAIEGGGISTESSNGLIIENSLTANEAQIGGGITINQSAINVIGNTLYNNFANYGGGISSRMSNTNLRTNIIKHNRADSAGGGIEFKGSDAEIVNNILAENYATSGFGGGVACFSTSLRVINNNIVSNSATKGCALYIAQASYPTMFNNIIWDNAFSIVDGEIYVTGGTAEPCTVVISHCNIDPSKCKVDPDGFIDWRSGIIDEDPLFVDSMFHLNDDSPCRNKGTGSETTLDGSIIRAPSKDLEGESRPKGPKFDIGVYEYESGDIMYSTRNFPKDYVLRSYPNPFNASCKIYVPVGSECEIIDINGRTVKAYNSSETQSGEITWHPEKSISAGVYTVRAKINDRTLTGRILYVK